MATKYEDIISIPKFGGINQSGDGYNTDMKYAQDGYGFDTTLGGFKPFPLFETSDTVAIDSGYAKPQLLGFINRRWERDEYGNVINADSYYGSYAIAIINDKLMYLRKYNNQFGESTNNWVQMTFNDESLTPVSFISSNRFDCVNYELNYTPPRAYNDTIKTYVQEGSKWFVMVHNGTDFGYYELEYDSETDKCKYKNNNLEYVEIGEYEDEENQYPTRVAHEFEAPVDALLITNSHYGMYCIYAPLVYRNHNVPETEATSSLEIVPVHVKPTTDLTTPDPDDIRFGCIELYNERIFGSGIDSDPDKLMYSAPNDPFNWEANIVYGLEADGAGDIQQPSWDGDKFISLKTFSNTLLCFKKQSIWRITGSNPSEFSFKKTYGEGTIADSTVVSHGYYTYFLTNEGIKAFDGTGTSHLKYGWINNSFFDGDSVCADKVCDYYAVNVDGKGILIYNTAESTFNIFPMHPPYYIAGIKTNKDRLYGLVCEKNSSTYKYNARFVELLKNKADGTNPHTDVVWESAWIDLSAKNITKSSFSVYMLLDSESVEEGTKVKGTVSIISERKTKTKNVEWTVNKPKKININNSGRLYKLRIEIPSKVDGVAQFGNWSMSAGIQMYLEYDYD